jgi:hypothetical protein
VLPFLATATAATARLAAVLRSLGCVDQACVAVTYGEAATLACTQMTVAGLMKQRLGVCAC